MLEQKILVVGEVFVDTHLDIIEDNGPLVRLGGVFHSARALAALGIRCSLAEFAPECHENDINEWSLFLKTTGCYKIGNIERAPNVMLIRESKEAGDQGYYNVLKDQAVYETHNNIRHIINASAPTDILLYPGRYDVVKVLNSLQGFGGRVHIDLQYDYEFLFAYLPNKTDSIIISASSGFYQKQCSGTLEGLRKQFAGTDTNVFLVKENRGGAICFSSSENAHYQSCSYHVPTMHSVGVGDVYNAVFISNLFDNDLNWKMQFAAICAAKYAETMSYERFRVNTQLMLGDAKEISTLQGIRLPWEERKGIKIYLAAPDFPWIDTTILETLYESLVYHNFSPRLPIRENGRVDDTTDFAEEIDIYNRDIVLLRECNLLIAVLLYNDPGTLVELGMFKQMGKKTIIFDPYGFCDNMFVRHTPDYLCKNIDEVVDKVFLCMGRRYPHDQI